MKSNSLQGQDLENNAQWEIADIVFNEGAMLALEVYQSTVQIVRLPTRIPQFKIDKEGLFDKIYERVRAFSRSNRDIDFIKYPSFSRKFYLSGEVEDAIRIFFNDDLISFLEENEIHHIESNGEALLLFKYVHIARTEEVQNMLSFSSNLL
jgi:hypothetical protein